MNHSPSTQLTYSSYLQLPSLLDLQKPKSPDKHDEMLFIVIHQTYELWFKQMLHEMDYLLHQLDTNVAFEVIHTQKRIRSILKLIVSQVDVIETMTSFAQFRSYLGTSSGFQSSQFRELEAVLGIPHDEKLLGVFAKDSNERKKIETRASQPNLWKRFVRFLSHYYNCTSEEEYISSLYRSPSICTEIAELMLDIDEGLQEWRYRHLKLVERMIGSFNRGTGGSDGAHYLFKTLSISFCPQLWSIRNTFYG